MAKLFNKFLVQRRDGTIPPWPWFVLGASDPAAPTAIRAYAVEAEQQGMDPEYIDDLYVLADRFEEWRTGNHTGDPDAAAHRNDDPDIVTHIPPHATENPQEK